MDDNSFFFSNNTKRFIEKYPQFSGSSNDVTIDVLKNVLPTINVEDVYLEKPIWKHFIEVFLEGGTHTNSMLLTYKENHDYFVSLNKAYDYLIERIILNKDLSFKILNHVLDVDRWQEISYNGDINELMLYSTSYLLYFMFDHIEGLYDQYRYIVDPCQTVEYNKDDEITFDYLINCLDTKIMKNRRKIKRIALCGFTGCGKSTIANVLVQNYKFRELTFGSSLKDVLSAMFGWDRQKLEGITEEDRLWREQEDPIWTELLGKSITPRKMLNEIGTQVMREHFHTDIWVKIVQMKLKYSKKVVITDCRFPNEFEMARKNNIKIVRIERGEMPQWAIDYQNGIETEESLKVHESNKLWLRENPDFVIQNNKTIKELHEDIMGIVFSGY